MEVDGVAVEFRWLQDVIPISQGAALEGDFPDAVALADQRRDVKSGAVGDFVEVGSFHAWWRSEMGRPSGC